MDPNAEQTEKVRVGLAEDGKTLIVSIKTNPAGRKDYDWININVDGEEAHDGEV